MLADGLYNGWLRHQRYLPKAHAFDYPIAMLLLDLDSLPAQFAKSRLWSLEKLNFISFYRRDYLRHPARDLKTAVCELIKQRSGESFAGTIKLLSHPRYLNVIFNPVSFYFCYQQEQLQYIVAEINNTPWNERHCYLLEVSQSQKQTLSFRFEKQFHVSPFMAMNQHYEWRFLLESDRLHIAMALFQDDQRQFDATLQMQHQALTAKAMRRLPLQYPMQTLRVIVRIYWQALRLWCKRIPFVEHPGRRHQDGARSMNGETHESSAHKQR
ncbi:Hypothetical protein Q7C_336 [Methylophaga frappieri]|uniref:Plasmid partition ParA protein n=1 Tax=Methylophaga frappieri (strain ATCC BAA-2434 / DSM 25690 / JAM7) TaxID=754477 RepID=I1YF21_METFJ|nr:DUF1365 domain-containing protein [Methylophaga frappieri]AFJ01514.1 Hypothetical protein Q7C_336 [Methylophaga frappieri]